MWYRLFAVLSETATTISIALCILKPLIRVLIFSKVYSSLSTFRGRVIYTLKKKKDLPFTSAEMSKGGRVKSGSKRPKVRRSSSDFPARETRASPSLVNFRLKFSELARSAIGRLLKFQRRRRRRWQKQTLAQLDSNSFLLLLLLLSLEI